MVGSLKLEFQGTFHHLIALFSTVAGKEHRARGHATQICNEINDLDRTSQGGLGIKPLFIKHLDSVREVTLEGSSPTELNRQRMYLDKSSF